MQPSQNNFATQSLASDDAPISPIALNTVVRRLSLTRNFLLILTGLSFLSLLQSLYQILFAGQNNPVYIVSGVISVLIFGGCFFLVSPKITQNLLAEPTRAKLQEAIFRVDVISLSIIGLLILAELSINLLSKGEGYLLAGFLVIPVIAAFVGLRQLQTTLIALISGGALAACIILNQADAANGFVISLTAWLMTYVASTSCVIVFTRRITNALRQVEEEKERNRRMVDILGTTHAMGFDLSRELSQMNHELTVAAEQQASSTQEQMAALTQVTSSLEELGETAQQIAFNATAVAEASRESVEIAGTVEGTGDLVVNTSVEGTRAVEQTNSSVRQVRNRIEILGQRLLNLTEQTKRVGNIIELIDEIANEAHLLALNASIEAAGSVGGGNTGASGTGSRQGERFGVIAQEIKNLSDRSREATEEIRQAIAEMQGAVAAAVLVAEEGKKDTAGALIQSEVAGKVIARLHEIIVGSTDSAITIRKAFQEFQERCTEIKLATNQQQSANQQILYTMRSLGEVYRQTAAGMSQLSHNSGRVQDQLVNLNTLLAEANVNRASDRKEAVALVAN